MATLTLTVNGRAQTVDVDPTTPLLYVRSDDLTLCGPTLVLGNHACETGH
jgi:aerobic-type carbon monoxide dehydrogenase small subunit (CoxS/CutS family)